GDRSAALHPRQARQSAFDRGRHARIEVCPSCAGIPRHSMSAALAGKVALVTGAARGIGRATARKLAAEGCDVAVNYYNTAHRAESLCAEIRGLGRRAVAIQGSVGMPDSVDEMFAELSKHFDR